MCEVQGEGGELGEEVWRRGPLKGERRGGSR